MYQKELKNSCLLSCEQQGKVQEWLQSIRATPDEKAGHLLIDRIETERTENKTGFNIESTLKPVLENMVREAGLEPARPE